MMTLLIMTSTLVVTLGTAALVTQGLLLYRTQKYSTAAYFAAETGAERILYEDRKNGFDFKRWNGTDCVSGDYIVFTTAKCGLDRYACCRLPSYASYKTALGNGYYFITYNADAAEIILSITGNYADTKRSLEISYEI